LLLNRSEGDDSENITNNSVTYFFEGLSGGIGQLERHHSSSAGFDTETLVVLGFGYLRVNDFINTGTN